MAEEFIGGDAELPDSLCDVGNPFVEEGIAAYAAYALYGIRADEASQAALVVDDAALPELVERFRRGVHVHLKQYAVVAHTGYALIGGIFPRQYFVHQSVGYLEIDGACFSEIHSSFSK